MDRTKVDLASKTLQADLDKLGDMATLAPAVSVDLISAFSDAKGFVLAGTWKRAGVELTAAAAPSDSSSDYGRTMIPIAPNGNYQMDIVFSKVGIGGVWVHLPLPNSEVMLQVGASYAPGYTGVRHAVAVLDFYTRSASETIPSTLRSVLEDKRAYRLQVGVAAAGDKATIVVAIDGTVVIRWTGLQSDLSVVGSWKQPQPKCIGLGVGGQTSATFYSARLLMLTGKAVPSDKLPAAPR
jgi:hypothetical protein